MAATDCFSGKALLFLYALRLTSCSDPIAVPFGSECTSTTKCGTFGTYEGGVGKCVKFACECGVSGRSCYGDNECCSGFCRDKIYTQSTGRNDPCKEGTCGLGYGCAMYEIDNVVLAPTPGKPWGLCEYDKPMYHTCDSKTFCRAEVSWPGGWLNCFNGRCDCKFDGICNSDSDCCSNWCKCGYCKPSTLGGFCSLEKNLLCLDNYGCTGKHWRQPAYGICEHCTKIGTVCNNQTYCCPIGHWPGGYGNCLNNICDCKVVGDCQTNIECCSGDCVNQRCTKGGLLDVCIKEPNSCIEDFECNSPSDELSVKEHFQLTRGTCKATMCGKQANGPRFAITSISKIRKKILHGETAVPNSWPWMANVINPGFCGAVIILRSYVLTAAHCLENVKDMKLLNVTLGSHYPINDPNGRKLSVTKIFKHPSYRNSTKTQADIAILQIDSVKTKMAPEEPRIGPVCLTDKQYPVGYECVATGWGQTYIPTDGSQPLASHLQQVKVKLFANNTRCSTEGIICTVGRGGPSRGDSGGPLMCKNQVSGQWELVGITSFGYPEDQYQTYVDVSYYKEWILQTIHDAESQIGINIPHNRPGRSCKRFLSK